MSTVLVYIQVVTMFNSDVLQIEITRNLHLTCCFFHRFTPQRFFPWLTPVDLSLNPKTSLWFHCDVNPVYFHNAAPEGLCSVMFLRTQQRKMFSLELAHVWTLFSFQ